MRLISYRVGCVFSTYQRVREKWTSWSVTSLTYNENIQEKITEKFQNLNIRFPTYIAEPVQKIPKQLKQKLQASEFWGDGLLLAVFRI